MSLSVKPNILILSQAASAFFFFFFPVCGPSAHVCCRFSCVQFFMTLWTVAHQYPLSMGFPRQEYWRGLPGHPSGHLPNPGNLSLLRFLYCLWILYPWTTGEAHGPYCLASLHVLYMILLFLISEHVTEHNLTNLDSDLSPSWPELVLVVVSLLDSGLAQLS